MAGDVGVLNRTNVRRRSIENGGGKFIHALMRGGRLTGRANLAAGQYQIEDLLAHPNAVFKQFGRGGIEARLPDGWTMRYDADDRFAGFVGQAAGMTIKLQSGFEIAKFSDLDYEGMTVELRYNGTPVAQLNRDGGKYNQEIEMPSRFSPEGEQFKFYINDFIEALEKARDFLATLE